jgi:hypothetical protein
MNVEKMPKEESHMARSDKSPSDTETIMMALDQISQTIDVMTSVVGRLRNYVQQQEAQAADKSKELKAEMRADRTLH